MNRKYILDQVTAAHKLQRMALEVAEQLSGEAAPLVIIGVKGTGMVIAEKIAQLVRQYLTNPVQVMTVSLDKQLPREVELSESIDLTGRHILLVDDVTNSGRTLLYALKPLLQYHPRTIHTLVLVERMHKQFPVNADFVGLSIATTQEDHIQVAVADGEVISAYLL
jgi:pyrimidine operon attenuation protein/uracil phosphoribosyltransferase